jgi:hypothetical protein
MELEIDRKNLDGNMHMLVGMDCEGSCLQSKPAVG